MLKPEQKTELIATIKAQLANVATNGNTAVKAAWQAFDAKMDSGEGKHLFGELLRIAFLEMKDKPQVLPLFAEIVNTASPVVRLTTEGQCKTWKASAETPIAMATVQPAVP